MLFKTNTKDQDKKEEELLAEYENTITEGYKNLNETISKLNKILESKKVIQKEDTTKEAEDTMSKLTEIKSDKEKDEDFETYKSNLLSEYDQLNTRISAMNDTILKFISTKKIANDDERIERADLLGRQLHAMNEYKAVLESRMKIDNIDYINRESGNKSNN